MNSLTLISLIAIIATTVSAQGEPMGLYARRALVNPASSAEHQAYQVRAAQITPANQQEFAQAQQARAAQASIVPAANNAQSQLNARQIQMMVRQVAEQASAMVSRWAEQMNKRQLNARDAASIESLAFGNTQ